MTDVPGIRRVADHVTDEAIRLGLADTRSDATRVVARMVEAGAVVTHEEGNLRYGNFIFEVDGRYVDEIYALEDAWCPACFGTGSEKVPDGTIPCQDCEGRTVAV